MRVGKFDPSRALRGLRTEIDTLFDRFVERPLEVLTGQPVPPVDISETDMDITIKVDLPGVDERNIDLSVVEDTLTIKGKKEEREETGRTYHVVERPTGDFLRTIHLSVPVRVDQIRANYRRGVLEVILPKKELSQARRIEIKPEVCE